MFIAYGKFWKGYFDFKGKMSRKDFWLALLAHFLVSFALGTLAQSTVGASHNMDIAMITPLIMAAFALLSVIPSLSAQVRRLRDAGYDWKMLFWALLPVIGSIILIVHFVKETGEGLREKCKKAGRHDMRYDKSTCTETCAVCGMREKRHDYQDVSDRCVKKCSVCGHEIKQPHNYKQVQDRCVKKCTVCGDEIESDHTYKKTDDPDLVRCSRCGEYGGTLHSFSQEEKNALKLAVDILVKANTNKDLQKSYEATAKKMNRFDSSLNLLDIVVLVTSAHQVNQALVQELQKQINAGNTNLQVINNIGTAANLKTAIDKFTKLTEKIKNKAVETTNKAAAETKAPTVAASDSSKPPLSSFASYDDSYQGYKKGGICDVCNDSLEGKKAYAVPNDVFYASPEYRAHLKKMTKTLTGYDMTEADIDRRAREDKTPGSAVCETCMHMFANVSAGQNEAKAGEFFERDNLGTRQETMSQANVYWLAERIQLKVKPPFTLFSMPSREAAEEAMLTLPFMHRAKDSGKLICDRMMTFGVYELEQNGKGLGTFEAMITGDDLTLAEFNQAEEAFTSFGGTRKNSDAPDASVTAETIIFGDPDKVKYDTTTKSDDGKNTYECYTAPDKGTALAFLKTKTVSKPLYYISVQTPAGTFGRDINGCYKVVDDSEKTDMKINFFNLS